MDEKTYTVTKTVHVGVVYPNDAMAEVCKLLLDEYELTPEQIANFALDLPGECEGINENRSEAAWEAMQERDFDDSGYRKAMIAAGRGHLLR